MNRCLDCGAERAADQCPVCGLTSAAAELVLRRRLVRRTAWFLAGSVIFLPVSQVFPPLDLDPMLIFLGMLFFGALGTAFWIDWRARRHQEVEVLKRFYFGLIPVPWLLAAALFLNGKFDTASPTHHPATVVSKFSMPGIFLRNRRLMVVSWREGQRLERIPVAADDFGRFQKGDQIVVLEQKGLLYIPWVSGVYRP